MSKQAVLLAAGSGTRLLPLTKDRPKCMVEISGRAIVDTLLDGLEPLGVSELLVVTGYCSDALENYLRADTRFSIRFIDNPRYATTNNILSLHVAKDAIEGDFLLVESDIFLRPSVLAPLAQADTMLLAPYTEEMDGTGVVLSPEQKVDEMVIRAHLHRPDDLARMHKTVNFYSFSKATWEIYRERLNEWVQKEMLDQYYEAVLAELINEGAIRLLGADVGHSGWAEVDDADDLARLEARIAGGEEI